MYHIQETLSVIRDRLNFILSPLNGRTFQKLSYLKLVTLGLLMERILYFICPEYEIKRYFSYTALCHSNTLKHQQEAI